MILCTSLNYWKDIMALLQQYLSTVLALGFISLSFYRKLWLLEVKHPFYLLEILELIQVRCIHSTNSYFKQYFNV